jgi:hypothetical protein
MAVRVVTRASEEPRRCAQGVSNQVAQRGVAHALIDAVAFAKPFCANDGLAHRLAMVDFKVTLREIMPYAYL